MVPFKQLMLVSSADTAAEDQRLLKLAEFMGVTSITISVEDFGTWLRNGVKSGTHAVALHAKTLAQMCNTPASAADALRFIDDSSTELLVFGCSSSEDQQRAIAFVTDGAVSRIAPLDDQSVSVALPRDMRQLSQQLAGLGFTGGRAEVMSTFELQHQAPGIDVVVEVDSRPTFVRLRRASSELFLLATGLPDIDEPVTREDGLTNHYAQLISPLIFLRHCFGERCWHAPESTARLIIDDPVLSEQYGFLDYDALIQSMKRTQFGTSIAFIPWNHWRTSRQNVSRFLERNTNLSICVHGCDHTNREFGAHAPALLKRKAGLAMRRMESHKQRTGAGYDQVMVFPQGVFSTAAISALRANNYLAAVNTTCFPTDNGSGDLRIRDLLRPAVTRYDGFPIFPRSYPRRMFDIAFNLFLGKPALVVEHHGYFSQGCDAMEKFVVDLYKAEPALTWPSLTDQLGRSCLERTLPDGSLEVQFFTRRFQFMPRGVDSQKIQLSKHEPNPEIIRSVLVDGVNTPFSFANGYLKLELPASEHVRNIEIVDQELPSEAAAFGLAHNARVLLRRGLSEFRDNTLARHVGLLRLARGVAKALRVTGDARRA